MTSRAEKAEETKQRIITHANDLFLRQGYLNTTVEQLASQAKVAKGSIFTHFGSKLKLALFIVQQEASGYVSAIGESLSRKETLENVFEEIFFQPETNSCLNLTQLLFSLYLEFNMSEKKNELNNLAKEYLNPIYEELGKIFKSLKMKKPLIRARIFIAILDGLALQISLEGLENDQEFVNKAFMEVKKLFNLNNNL
jgi:AcrR family transcriptional regulator